MTTHAADPRPLLPDALQRRALLLTAGVLVGLGLVLWLVPMLQEAFFLTFFAVTLAAILRRPIDWLSRFMPRWLATLITTVLALGLIALLVVLALPIIREQGAKLVEQAPAALRTVQRWWRRLTRAAPIEALGGAEINDAVTDELQAGAADVLGKLLPGTVLVVGGIGYVLVQAIYISYEPGFYARGFLKLIPRRHERDVADVLTAMDRSLKDWTRATLISMTTIGTLTAVGLLLVGVDSWLVLGLISFFGEFIPYVGPFLSLVPGVAMGLAESPTTALYAALVYMGVQGLEGNVVQPLVMKSTVKLAPVVYLVGQLLLASAFGFLGVLVAAPLMAVVQTGIRVGYIEKVLGKDPTG